MTPSMRFDVQARSREFLRRGLLLSGAIHLTLLLAFLNLPGSGNEVLLRSYGRATDIFRQPITPSLVPLPPSGARSAASSSKTGAVVPVPTLRPPKFEFHGFGDRARPVGMEPGANAVHGAPGGDAPLEVVDPGRVYRVIEVDVAPVAIEQPKPPYPDVAKDQWITGRVVAEVLVQADGGVRQVRIVSGNKVLSDSVQETLYRWRFRPATVRGRPVAVWVEIPVNFTL